MNNEYKLCVQCKSHKDKSDFLPKRRKCKDCFNKNQLKYYYKNKDYILEKNKNRYANDYKLNPDKYDKKRRKEVSKISDAYIRNIFKITGINNYNIEMIEAKREIIKIKRLIKQQ